MRLDPKAFSNLMKNQNLRVSSAFGGAVATARANESSDGSIERIIDSLKTSEIDVEHDEQMFRAHFRGAALLSMNRLLRLDHRTGELKRYRAACHDAAYRAVMLTGKRQPALPKGLVVSLSRSGVKPFDNDALVASFKFITDGFRVAGLLAEDDPAHIIGYDNLQQHCGHGVPLSIGITFRLPN